MKYEELTHKINNWVRNESSSTLGNGFQEVIYQRALAIEMEKNRLPLLVKWRWSFFTKELILEQEG